MKSNRFQHWLQNIYKTQEEEISCSECFDLVSHFVEVELSGEDPVAQMPQLKQHLEQCSTCHDEYETLRDLSRFENEGGVPSLDHLRSTIR